MGQTVTQAVSQVATGSSSSLGYDAAKFIVQGVILLIIFPSLIWFFTRFLRRQLIQVKEIKSTKDKDIEGFRELYVNRIPKEMQINPVEILEYIDDSTKNEIQHHLLVCKNNSQVVGFIKFMVCVNPKYIFVAYIAIDNKNAPAKEKAVYLLLKRLWKKYVKKYDIPFVISEIKQTSNIRNNSLARNFAFHATTFGKKAYLLDFDYIMPKMPNELNDATEEEFMSLLVIPSHEIEYPKMEKELLLKIIKSIYYKIYYPSCHCLGGKQSYEEYLNELVKAYDPTDKNIEMILLNK